MTRTIRVPDPVYDRIEREAERKDCVNGEVVRGWMEDSDRLGELEVGR